MTRVSITVTSHLGDVTITHHASGEPSDNAEASSIEQLLTACEVGVVSVYSLERKATPTAVKRPEWGNVALVEDLRELAREMEPFEGITANLRAQQILRKAAERIEELSRGDA